MFLAWVAELRILYIEARILHVSDFAVLQELSASPFQIALQTLDVRVRPTWEDRKLGDRPHAFEKGYLSLHTVEA